LRDTAVSCEVGECPSEEKRGEEEAAIDPGLGGRELGRMEREKRLWTEEAEVVVREQQNLRKFGLGQCRDDEGGAGEAAADDSVPFQHRRRRQSARRARGRTGRDRMQPWCPLSFEPSNSKEVEQAGLGSVDAKEYANDLRVADEKFWSKVPGGYGYLMG
jgi:hypothetical protein